MNCVPIKTCFIVIVVVSLVSGCGGDCIRHSDCRSGYYCDAGFCLEESADGTDNGEDSGNDGILDSESGTGTPRETGDTASGTVADTDTVADSTAVAGTDTVTETGTDAQTETDSGTATDTPTDSQSETDSDTETATDSASDSDTATASPVDSDTV